jgi:transcription termination factor Rho
MSDHAANTGGPSSRRRRRRRGGRGRTRPQQPPQDAPGFDDTGLPAGQGFDEPSPPPPDPEQPFEKPSMDALYEMGVLDATRDGHGFLRSPARGYIPLPEDAYIPPNLLRQYGLRDGVTMDGEVGPPKRRGQNPQLVRPTSICGVEPHLYHKTPKWDILTVIDPQRRIDLTEETNDITLRIIDMLCPIGFGQRGLLVSPPRAGKTIILQKIAQAVQENHPEAYLMVLLVDERPEEATAMRRAVKGEVAVSTNDKPPENHVHVTETALKKAKRLVETGMDVVILMDSLTRLGRAYNLLQRGGGRTLSGGMDSRTLERPKAFFGAARKVEDGGSLTIIATALIDTGSRMDQVIFEEFKGTGNMELVLDRDLAEQRIWPAIDVNKSGTRKEELLLAPSFLEKVYMLRRVLNKVRPVEAMELLIDRMSKTESNEEFVNSLATKRRDDD